jgi:sulfite reductase (ferredoxin)
MPDVVTAPPVEEIATQDTPVSQIPVSQIPVSQIPVKETKAQRAERLKLVKNPWENWNDVRNFAKEGRAAVTDDWTGLYFKWWGIYTQGDGLGVTGGKGGEGVTSEFFMMRIGIPNGLLTSHQLRTIGHIAQKHARNLADITTRQAIQLHWLTLADLVEVTDALTEVGLSPKGACGDVVRNVTGCPLAGISHDELLDASPLATEVAQYLTANPDFYNLPRKFKISITGCPLWCSYPEINDVGLTAVQRILNGQTEVGYTLRVGGGLSTEPHLAVRIPVFVPQNKAMAVITALVQIFREQDQLRESRTQARVKYLFMKHGWTADSMLAAIEAKLGYQLDPSPVTEDTVPDDLYRDHVGISPQKQAGLSSVGISVLRGRLSGDQLVAMADLAEKYGSGHLRTSIMQNILLVNIRNEVARDLIADLSALDLTVEASTFWRGAIACTGTEFCKLAISETKAFTKWLVSDLEERLPGFDQQLRLHVTGCTNSCGQSWIADIGLEGKKIKKDGKLVDAFYFCVGGSVGKHAGIARQIGYRAAADETPQAIERMLRGYLAARTPNEDLRAYLNGAPIIPVERDAPPARGSHAPDA